MSDRFYNLPIIIREEDWIIVWGTILAILIAIYLNPIHQKNIQKLRHNTHITNPWESEKKGQEYTLQDGDWVFFWKPDEKPVRVGMVRVLWGYYRIIAHKDGMTEFRDVEWCNANF